MNRPDVLSFLNTSPTLGDSRDAIASLAEKLRPAEETTRMAAALLTMLTTRLASLLASLPSPLLFAVALVAALSLARLVHRVVSFVTRLAFRLLFWALVAACVAVMYEKGVEGSVAAAREACGYVFDAGVFFWREWERFERAREREGKMRSGMAY